MGEAIGMMPYARKVDRNHGEIRDALRALGVGVVDTSSVGGGFPDLTCFWRGRTAFVEVKDGKKSPSARKLTAAQVAFRDTAAAHGVSLHVVTNVAGALAIFGARVELTGPENYAENA